MDPSKTESDTKASDTAGAASENSSIKNTLTLDHSEPAITSPASSAALDESEKKARIAMILGAIAVVILAGTKFIFGASFFYLAALIVSLIALYFALKTSAMTKKAVLALVLACTPLIISGYNLLGLTARDAIIDAEFHHVEHEVDRDVRKAVDFLPDEARKLSKDTENAYDKLDDNVKKDVAEFVQKVKEDAAKQSDSSSSSKDSSDTSDKSDADSKAESK